MGKIGLHAWFRDTIHALSVATILIFVVITFGTIGFVIIENWSVLDAFYMTITTLATVGYGEVHPLSSVGKLFACILIFTSVGVAAYCFALVGRTVVEGELKKLRGFYRMQKLISSFHGHTIVCGYGRLARNVVPELVSAGQQVVVIENAPARVAELESAEVPFVEGNAYEEETLAAAGIQRAKNLLAFLSKDADNVYISLCAREMNPALHIVGRAESDTGEKKLKQAGAHRVLSPYRIGATRVVQSLIRPNVSEFLELTSGKIGNELVLEEVVVPETSPIGGKTIESSGLRSKTGVIIAAIINREGTMDFNPGRENVIAPGSTLIVLGKPGSVRMLTEMLVSD